jgi:diguanylate cyclase (GGDEF)-like protein
MDENEKKHCLLAIDDSPMQLRALSHILSPLYEVKVAKSGTSGIDLAQRYDVDLILLDLIMPDMSGFEVLSALKNLEETKDIPVIFITGSDSNEDEEKGLALGAVDYIRKPFVDSIVKLRVGIHLQLIDQMKIIESFGLLDGLTGVNNRRNFDRVIKTEWNRAMRTKEWLGMLMLDIDKFKTFNDTYGHINGDTCLKTVAHVMQSTVMRGNDFVFRWGGEEFAVLLPSTALDGAITVAERLRENIATTPIQCGGDTVFVTVSMGVGTIIPSTTDMSDEFNTFCVNLDKALYRAKENGRNRVEQM